MSIASHIAQLKSRFGESLAEAVHFRDETTIRLRTAGKIKEVCAFAKEVLDYKFLVDITSVDNPDEELRFLLVYELYGHEHRQHLRLHAAVPEEACEIPSVASIWRGAEWLEREVYDMMGIRFSGHPDLRRIIMWEGYPYYPLRKDFPLAGKPTDLGDVAFTQTAPMEGGPFVTSPGMGTAEDREPRAKPAEQANQSCLDTTP